MAQSSAETTSSSELDPLGERAGDERRGDDGEHLLVHEVRLGGDVRSPRSRQLADTRQRGPVQVADGPPDVAREGERVAEEHPDRGDDAHRDERLHLSYRQEVLAADQTSVEEREAWGHQRHERSADEDERSVARIDPSMRDPPMTRAWRPVVPEPSREYVGEPHAKPQTLAGPPVGIPSSHHRPIGAILRSCEASRKRIVSPRLQEGRGPMEGARARRRESGGGRRFGSRPGPVSRG